MDSSVMYGQEYGKNLISISKKLLSNENLMKLLTNTDLDPLNKPLTVDPYNDVLNNIVAVVPMLIKQDQTNKSKLVIIFDGGSPSLSNHDIEQIDFTVYIYCPYQQWLITGDQLRPFAIISEIRKSLQDKKINGLGTIKYLGFALQNLSDEVGCYTVRFNINAFT